MSRRVRLGKAISYDFQAGTVTYRYPFIDMDHASDIEDEIKATTLCKISIEPTSHEEESMNYEQQKKFFAMIADILRFSKLPVTALAIRDLYEDFQEAYFPVKERRVQLTVVPGTKDQPPSIVKREVPRMRSVTSLSKRELAKVISRIHANYDDLGVKWSRD